MCDPVTAASLAVSAAGSYMQSREAVKNQNRMQAAKNAAFQEGMIRQRQYADEAGAAFGGAVKKQGAEGLKDTMEQSVAKRLQAFNDNRLGNQSDYSVATPNAPKNVVLDQERAFGEAKDTADRDNTALARLGGYGGALFDTALDRNEYARAFGNLSDKATRDSNLIGLDIQSAANNAYKPPSLFPTLLKAGGSAAAMYSAGGGNWFDEKGGVPTDGSYGPAYKPGVFTKIGGYF